MAEFAAGYTGAKVEVADSDGIVLDVICEVVVSFGHCTDEDGNTFILVKALDVVPHPHHFSVETESDLPAIGREVVCDGILDNLDELLLGGR
jgi:hypothetical protein